MLERAPKRSPSDVRRPFGLPPRRLVLAVGALYLLLQQLLFSLQRAVSWDEAVYLSQVTPGMRALPFVASRARGTSVLAWPVAATGASLPLVRLAFSIASAFAGAYAVWVPLLGAGAAVAAVAFGTSWVALLYGSEVMPNLWSGLLAVAAVGVATRPLAMSDTRWGWPAAAALLFMIGLFRPPDVVPVLGAILVVAIGSERFDPRRRALLIGHDEGGGEGPRGCVYKSSTEPTHHAW